MKRKSRHAERRTDALSKERIVEAAIGILDAQGEAGLTLRAVAKQFSTGIGAIYWHIANKDELLEAATDDVIARAMAAIAEASAPGDTIRAIALGVFDAIDAHPWVGTQFSRSPLLLALAKIVEGIGGSLHKLGIPEPAQYECTSILVNYILGTAGQNAANAMLAPRLASRTEILSSAALRWTQLDPAEFPFVHRMAAVLPRHDDRQQFLAGIDLILAGIQPS